MPVNSRRKGKAAELEIAALVRTLFPGVEARRGQQYCGRNGDADVVGLNGVHIEVKRRASAVDQWMQQAVEDAPGPALPTVWHRGDRCDWLVSVRLCDLVDFARLVMDARRNMEGDE